MALDNCQLLQVLHQTFMQTDRFALKSIFVIYFKSSQTHKLKGTHRNTHKNRMANIPLRAKGVNVRSCFYLLIIKGLLDLTGFR